MKAWKQSTICFEALILSGILAIFLTITTFSQDSFKASIFENSSAKLMGSDLVVRQNCGQAPYRLLEQDLCKIPNSSLEANYSSPAEVKENFWDFDSSMGGDNANERWLFDFSRDVTSFDFTRREDKSYIYYEILVRNLNKESLNVKIKNDVITVTGRRENSSYRNISEQHFSFSKNDSILNFRSSFPTPKNVDTGKFSTEYQNNKLTLKFPKVQNGR